MSEKFLVCKGATVYCSKSISNNNIGTAIPLNITSQTTVCINGDKVVATEKDSTVANMNFGICNSGSVPSPPCTANIQWSKVYEGVDATSKGLKLLTEESEGVCSCGGGLVKIAFHGQITTPQKEEVDDISHEVLSGILPINVDFCEEINIESVKLEDDENEVKIVSIEILDDKGIPLTEDYEQFVNLPKEQRFIDNITVKGLYQLGTNIRCRVRFNGGGIHKFNLSIIEDVDNIKYSNSEKSRNPAFRCQEEVLEFLTDIDGEKVIGQDNIFLSQAGGNKYHLSAKDTLGNIVESVKIKTLRKLYFVEVKMEGLFSITDSLTTLIEEYRANFIILEKLDDAIIPYIPNIDTQEKEIFLESVKSAYSEYNEMDPYCIAIAYTDHLAVKESNFPIVLKDVQVGVRGAKPVRVFISKNGKKESLWYNIDDANWFVYCKYIDAANNEFRIKKRHVTPFLKRDVNGSCGAINIDVSWLPLGVGKIELRVHIVNRMRYGISFKRTNIVAICTKSRWKVITEDKQNQTAIHEIGHKVGMVPNGENMALDKPINYYDSSQGHNGKHCHSGIPTQEFYNGYAKLSTCVMYGSLNEPFSFCPDCANCVRKTEVIIK